MMSATFPSAVAPDAAAKPHPAFFPSLDASRGIAALMVAMFHAGQANYLDAKGNAVPLVSGASSLAYRMVGNGHGAVIFFFVLSGFVLMLMLQRGPQDPGGAASCFFISRIFRIFPAILSTVAIFAIVFALTGRGLTGDAFYTWPILIQNALLIRVDINGVMWSLQLEMIAVPVILVAYLMARRWGPRVLVGLAVILAALSFAGSWNKLIGAQTSLGPLYCFIVGMIACRAGQARRDDADARIWLGIGIVGFLGARALFGWTSNWAVVAETTFAAIVVAALSYGRVGWRFAQPLARLFSFYGHISYSFYLLHPLTLIVIWKCQPELGRAVAAGYPPVLVALALFIASTVAITPLAWLQQRFVERYGIAIGRRVVRAWETHAPASRGDPAQSASRPRL